MPRRLSRSTVALALLGAALLSAPAFATDFSEDGNFGGTYSYIGPGVASFTLHLWVGNAMVDEETLYLDVVPTAPESDP